MDFSRLIPYDPAVLDAVVGYYNAAIWPIHLAAAALLALVLAVTVAGQGRVPARAALSLLAVLWLWCGIRFLGGTYAQLNWAGTWFQFLWIAEAGLLLLAAVLASPGRRRPQRAKLAGGGLVLVALAWPPLAALVMGRELAQASFAGTGADATCLFTLGVLVMARRHPWWLWVLPVVWMVFRLFWWSVAGAPDRMVMPALGVAAALLIAVLAILRRPAAR